MAKDLLPEKIETSLPTQTQLCHTVCFLNWPFRHSLFTTYYNFQTKNRNHTVNGRHTKTEYKKFECHSSVQWTGPQCATGIFHFHSEEDEAFQWNKWVIERLICCPPFSLYCWVPCFLRLPWFFPIILSSRCWFPSRRHSGPPDRWASAGTCSGASAVGSGIGRGSWPTICILSSILQAWLRPRTSPCESLPHVSALH